MSQYSASGEGRTGTERGIDVSEIGAERKEGKSSEASRENEKQKNDDQLEFPLYARREKED